MKPATKTLITKLLDVYHTVPESQPSRDVTETSVLLVRAMIEILEGDYPVTLREARRTEAMREELAMMKIDIDPCEAIDNVVDAIYKFTQEA